MTKNEMLMAGLIGLQRSIESKGMNIEKNKYRSSKGAEWERDIRGAMAELAVAKLLNLHWEGSVNNFGERPDVGEYEVRSTSKDTYSLIIRPSDNDNDVFILVVTSPPTFRVAGWITAEEGKDKKWMKNPGGKSPAFFVPQDSLRDVSELPEITGDDDDD